MARKTAKQAIAAPPTINRLAITTDFLDIAVPLYIAQLRELPADEFAAIWRRWIDEDELDTAGVFSEILPAGGGKPGDAARAFNALAKAVAALAFAPGGVSFGSREYAAQPSDELEEVMNDGNSNEADPLQLTPT